MNILGCTWASVSMLMGGIGNPLALQTITMEAKQSFTKLGMEKKIKFYLAELLSCLSSMIFRPLCLLTLYQGR